MEAKELISHLNAVGFSIGCESSQLLITPAGKLTEELKQAIRENKAAILAELKGALLQQPFSGRSDNGRYSVVVTDASTDPVLVEVTIHGLASFTMEIPHAHYDGIALLQVIEQHSAQAALNPSGDTQPSTIAKECSQAHPGEPKRRAA